MIQQEIQNPYITWMNNMAVNLPKPDQGNKVPVTAASGTNLKTYDPNGTPAPADGQIFNDYSAMNADMKQPATTPTATATPAQQPQAYDPQKYIDAIFKQEVPKPEYDQQRQTRTRDLSKVLALGDALSTLGDVFALSKGANVTPRGPNNDVRQLRTEWQGYEDNYKQRMDQHNREVFQNRLNALRYGSQMQYQMDRDKTRDTMDKERFDWQKNIQDQQLKSIDKDREERRKDREEDNKLREEQFKFQKDMEQKRYGLEAGRYQIAKDAEKRAMLADNGLNTDDKDNIILSGDQIGQDIKVDKRYRDKLLALIVTDELLTDADMDILQPSMGESVTTNQKDFIIAKHWHRSPAVQKWLTTEGNAKITAPQTPAEIPTQTQSQSTAQIPQAPRLETGETLKQQYGIDITKGNIHGQAYDYVNSRRDLTPDQRSKMLSEITNTATQAIKSTQTADTMRKLGYENPVSTVNTVSPDFSEYKRKQP